MKCPECPQRTSDSLLSLVWGKSEIPSHCTIFLHSVPIVRILLLGQIQIYLSPLTDHTITRMGSTIEFPAGISTKIGATITQLTDTEGGCVLGCGEVIYCCRNLTEHRSVTAELTCREN